MRLPLMVLFPLFGATVRAQDPARMLYERIVHRIAGVPGATVGVVYRDLQTSAAVFVNPDTVFHAASTMKLPVLIEYFRSLDRGRLRPDQDLLLVNRFASIVDGSPYSLNAGDDSDSALYRLAGTRVPLGDLAERMITRSSNLATNTLIDLVGAPEADATARALGADSMKVLRGVEDSKAFARGLNNVTSARDLSALLMAVESGRAASPAATRRMRDILFRQELNTEIPAGLPPGTRVAHKTGWITGVLHDAAIVYPSGRRPYVLVVLTKGITEREDARALIRDISRMVWDFAVGGAAATPGVRRAPG